MLRPLVTVTAAALLLAGCNGGDDKATSSDPGESAQTPTPTAPELPTFDPPKAFTAVTGLAQSRPEGPMEIYGGKAGIVGKTALYANKYSLSGVWIDGGSSWQVPAKEIASTTTTAYTAPMAVQLDGKEVIAMAYAQNVEAGGTQKAHGQVEFRWIDPAEGKVLTTATVDVTAAIGPGTVVSRLISQAYDPATGQVAMGVDIQSPDGAGKVTQVTAYADPKTKKAVVIPDVAAAGVLGGTVVGSKGHGQEGATNLALVVADGATGAIKKTIPVPTMNYLTVQGTGGKYGYVSGQGYDKAGSHYIYSMYAVDIASGAVVETKLPNAENDGGYTCQSDHVTSLVCNHVSGGNSIDEILAFDDSTGKKSWGYSDSAGRVVANISTVYNGYVYGQAEKLPAVLDAKTGQDVPGAAPAPGSTPTRRLNSERRLDSHRRLDAE